MQSLTLSSVHENEKFHEEHEQGNIHLIEKQAHHTISYDNVQNHE